MQTMLTRLFLYGCLVIAAVGFLTGCGADQAHCSDSQCLAANSLSDEQSSMQRQRGGAHPFEDTLLYRYDWGYNDVKGYDTFWCDTFLFRSGKVYTSSRTETAIDECSLELDLAGEYQVQGHSIVARFYDGQQVVFTTRSEQSPFIVSQAAGQDHEINRYYNNSSQVVQLLSTSEYQANGDRVFVESNPKTAPRVGELVDLKMVFDQQSCQQVNEHYRSFTLSGPALTDAIAGPLTVGAEGTHWQITERPGESGVQCVIDFSLVQGLFFAEDFQPGDRYYFVAQAINSLEDIKVSIAVGQ